MAKAIMIQGTMSNSGKSFLTAGLCRVFWQDGYRTADIWSEGCRKVGCRQMGDLLAERIC